MRPQSSALMRRIATVRWARGANESRGCRRWWTVSTQRIDDALILRLGSTWWQMSGESFSIKILRLILIGLNHQTTEDRVFPCSVLIPTHSVFGVFWYLKKQLINLTQDFDGNNNHKTDPSEHSSTLYSAYRGAEKPVFILCAAHVFIFCGDFFFS